MSTSASYQNDKKVKYGDKVTYMGKNGTVMNETTSGNIVIAYNNKSTNSYIKPNSEQKVTANLVLVERKNGNMSNNRGKLNMSKVAMRARPQGVAEARGAQGGLVRHNNNNNKNIIKKNIKKNIKNINGFNNLANMPPPPPLSIRTKKNAAALLRQFPNK